MIDHKIFANKDRTEFDRMIIRNVGDDNYPGEHGGAHMRDSFIDELSQRAGFEMDERTYASATVYANGEYWGLYEIREKIVHESFTDAYYDQDADSVDMISCWGFDTVVYGDRDPWDALTDEASDKNLAKQAAFDAIAARLNVRSLSDYVIMNNWVVSSDWLNYNTAWWRGTDPEVGALKWRYVLWDMDAAFGHYENYSNVPSLTPTHSPCAVHNSQIEDPEGHLILLDDLLQNDGFQQFYVSRLSHAGRQLFQHGLLAGAAHSV